MDARHHFHRRSYGVPFHFRPIKLENSSKVVRSARVGYAENVSFLLRRHTEPRAIKAAMYGFDTVILGLAPIYMQEKPRLIDRKSGSGRKVGSQFNCKLAGTELAHTDRSVRHTYGTPVWGESLCWGSPSKTAFARCHAASRSR